MQCPTDFARSSCWGLDACTCFRESELVLNFNSYSHLLETTRSVRGSHTMSVFQRLRQMPIGDVLHRGVLYTIVGISGWGIFMIGAVHMDTMKRGRGTLAR